MLGPYGRRAMPAGIRWTETGRCKLIKWRRIYRRTNIVMFSEPALTRPLTDSGSA